MRKKNFEVLQTDTLKIYEAIFIFTLLAAVYADIRFFGSLLRYYLQILVYKFFQMQFQNWIASAFEIPFRIIFQ